MWDVSFLIECRRRGAIVKGGKCSINPAVPLSQVCIAGFHTQRDIERLCQTYTASDAGIAAGAADLPEYRLDKVPGAIGPSSELHWSRKTPRQYQSPIVVIASDCFNRLVGYTCRVQRLDAKSSICS